MSAPVVAVVVAAGAASWEAQVLSDLEGEPRVRVMRRCVDLADLLACLESDQPAVAVVAGDLPGLDLDVVETLRSQGVGVVAVGDPARSSRIGADITTGPPDVAVAVADAAARRDQHTLTVEQVLQAQLPPRIGRQGRLVGVWGPPGAPGRSAIAASLAGLSAATGHLTVLVDADLQGGVQAQAWGILDDVSGFLAATRAVNRGREQDIGADAVTLEPGLHVFTGISRAQLAPHVRVPAARRMLEVVRQHVDRAIVDLGPFAPSPDRGPGHLTEAVLEIVDDLVVVGRADPLGVARLTRCLVDLDEVHAPDPIVVLNHARRSSGWSETEVVAAVRSLAGRDVDVLVPQDVALWDEAVRRGVLPHRVGPRSPFMAAVTALLGRLSAPAGARVDIA